MKARRGFCRWAGIACVATFAAAAYGASPIDVYSFADEQQEARYRALVDEFRCPKCLNTNLSGSDAPIAQDLRATVHRLIVERGMTDAEIRQFLLERYGDFVLYDPPLHRGTLALWLAPGFFLAIGIAVVVRKRRHGRTVTLTGADEVRIKQILES